MKTFRILFSALGLAGVLVTAAHADGVGPYKGHKIDLGTISGFAYYTEEKDGYHVVATLADADSKAVRFETVLTPGQAVVLTSPAKLGAAPAKVQISRENNSVQVQNIVATH